MDRRRNFLPLIGFVVCLAAFLSYFLFFSRFPVTRDVPWTGWLLFALGLGLLTGGLLRAFRQPEPATTREHLAKTGWTYTFLSDPQAEVVRRYDLLHVVGKQTIARPAELLIDPTGTVRWRDLTEDYRMRTRPEAVLDVFDRLTGRVR